MANTQVVLAHRELAEVKAMGKVFSSAALSPFLMQFTIHRREQIAAQSQHQGQHKHQNCVEVCSPFLTLAERLWQILAKVTG